MKKVEIVEIGKKSAFKTTMYIMIIPMAFMMLIGLLLFVIGIALGSGTTALIGLPYLIMPVFLIFVYGGLSALAALVYNLFAKKYGGLEYTLKEIDTEPVDNRYKPTL
ncbi:hypothetical protein Back11_45450 [Paenibacillus baekrokdamisoli]|uniref:Uncharacterized protein n=1 Tax=Paenibacillus baekrokdamisoli TaxID=1712516 RepID=A0A3G9IWH2_9BACL|nr:hypothetical protein [Paenibacillus baekrokdamisoli]MBB3072330.1 phosphotransferase system glucose/maltose/N-acetylglucosamine-specific IIC component [Paenibacillus baekrokdamisoli]BBH23200.1 hypothetical protein Back11_45450 [Paenibacillus baekrokdamisoli]